MFWNLSRAISRNSFSFLAYRPWLEKRLIEKTAHEEENFIHTLCPYQFKPRCSRFAGVMPTIHTLTSLNFDLFPKVVLAF
jgi:hypothetical protein